MGRWSTSLGLGCFYLLLAVVDLVPSRTGWGLDPARTVRFATYAAAYLVLMGSIAWALRRHPSRRNAFTYALLVAFGVYTVGDYVSDLTVDLVYGHDRQLADPGDALMLGAYTIALTGYVRLVARARERVSLARTLDTMILTVALGTLAWITLVVPGLRSPLFQGHPSSAIVCALFPVLDLVLLAVGAIRVMSRLPVSWGAIIGLACPALLLVGDCLDFANLIRDRQAPDAAHVAWLLAYGAVAVAVNAPAGANLGTGARELDARLTARHHVPWLFGMGMLPVGVYGWQLVHAPSGGSVPDGSALSVSMLLMFALVVARAAGMLRTSDQQSEVLEVLARNDHLTGLPNRRTGDAELGRALLRVEQTGEPLSVTIIDLDRFKAFNDSFGHHAGDELLVGCAHRWSDLLGPAEVLARYGGEEFVLVTVGLPTSAVLDLLDRLRAATPRQQTFSAGVAQWQRDDSAADLVARADEALYAAKANGRARTYLWETRDRAVDAAGGASGARHGSGGRSR
ncbi:diguanylate cyclase [Arsenicicoccus sp. MKL-02]|uniref:Diguanylate cyclase n=1 Tax=Arsenicicoccus cauae TaxID=2663847 RepID=A0A6I3I9C5_9MICO|nr:GGDEF domain-containing protein [Arsenicicoccus cauae]MTB72774.1 diguanylate cyclase [Arsenicicoccus cauae]